MNLLGLINVILPNALTGWNEQRIGAGILRSRMPLSRILSVALSGRWLTSIMPATVRLQGMMQNGISKICWWGKVYHEEAGFSSAKIPSKKCNFYEKMNIRAVYQYGWHLSPDWTVVNAILAMPYNCEKASHNCGWNSTEYINGFIHIDTSQAICYSYFIEEVSLSVLSLFLLS